MYPRTDNSCVNERRGLAILRNKTPPAYVKHDELDFWSFTRAFPARSLYLARCFVLPALSIRGQAGYFLFFLFFRRFMSPRRRMNA